MRLQCLVLVSLFGCGAVTAAAGVPCCDVPNNGVIDRSVPARPQSSALPSGTVAAPAQANSGRDRPITPGVSPAAASSAPGHPQTLRATALAPVTVSAFPIAAAINARQRLTPGTVSVIGAERLHRRAVTNMSDALRYVPGVLSQSNTGADGGVVSIRGSNLSALNYDNSGVALFQDGLPVTTADGANHNRLLNPATARYVIVANGANALTYGASVLGGAIDFISSTALNSDPNQITISGGSYGLVSGQVSTGGVSGDYDGMLTVGGKHFSGWRRHGRANRSNVRGNAGWRISDALNLRVFASYINSRQALAGSLTRAEFEANPRQADPAYARGKHQVNVKTGRLAAIGNWTIDSASWLEFGASWEVQSLYHPIVDVFNPDPPPVEFFSLLIDTTQRTAAAMVRYHLETGAHKFVAGVNLAHTSNAGGNFENRAGQRGPRTDDVDQHADNMTLFALDRWTIAPRWTLVYGAQGVVTSRHARDLSLADQRVRDQQQTYTSINPRLGLLYALDKDNEAFASVSRVYEAPNNFQLDNDARKDDSTLRAMHGLAYEIGARGQRGSSAAGASWRWSVSLYYAPIHNEILSVADPAQPGNMLSTDYGDTTHAGVESLVRASFPVAGEANRIEPLISISWDHFRFDDDPIFGDNRLPYAPRYVVHGQVMYRNRQTGFYIGPTFDLAGSRYADMGNTYRVDGYSLVGWRAGIQRDRWTLFAEARNLADKDYVNAVSVRTRADAGARVLNPGAPRTVYVGLRIHY